MMPPADLLGSVVAWLPELILSAGALVVLLVWAFARRRYLAVMLAWSALGLAAWALTVIGPLTPGTWFSGLIVLDQASWVFRWLSLGVIALVILMAAGSSDVEPRWTGEYLALLLLVGVGLMLMAQANHLLSAYLAVEMVSLACYVLVALVRDARSSEAALKYLLFGALCSGIMLFGMSLLYGLSGALGFPEIQQTVERLASSNADLGQAGAFTVALALILAGLAFKISMVPFHMWTPDVYEGAPLPVTAMLSVGPKAAGLALLLRISWSLSPLWDAIAPVAAALAILTMTFGNLVALPQANVKRLLAYSTIAQVGYLLIGFVANSPTGIEAMLVYLVAYLFMNLGAFACVVAVCAAGGDESLEAFQGLAQRSPPLAALCAVFLLSLAGIPPLVGFIGKFELFRSAIDAGRSSLAIAAAVNSAIALYYYVNLIRLMYLLPPTTREPIRPAASVRLALAACAVATVWLGLFPGSLIGWLQTVATATNQL
ncbi:MAG: NADH-quinone oxidoreductase subunit N [Candidatus Omnitrophica bacterium]|nr:NADH-quinone oxidoreductase subunit N [Candidatus Omnitrophota bacterium]